MSDHFCVATSTIPFVLVIYKVGFNNYLSIYVWTEKEYRLLQRRIVITPELIEELKNYYDMHNSSSFPYYFLNAPFNLQLRINEKHIGIESFKLSAFFAARNGNLLKLDFRYYNWHGIEYSSTKLLWKNPEKLLFKFTIKGR